MSDKLKPCPFCGGEATMYYDLDAGMYWILCNRCAATNGKGISREATINAWNTREPMERIVERLEERYAKLIHKVVSDWQKSHLNDYEDFVAEGIEEAIEIVKEEGGV